MPIDLWSVLVLIMLNAAEMVKRLGPYVVSGIIVATLLSWIVQGRSWTMPSRMPRPLVTPLACLIGVVSPLPTTGVVPVVVRLRAKGLPAGAASAFVLASSLMNPQLLLLTAGAFGMQFALMQLGSVLILSVGMGLMLAWGNGEFHSVSGNQGQVRSEQCRNCWTQLVDLTGHVTFHFLVGVLVGASLQVLLLWLRIPERVGTRGWFSNPMLGWVGAPFYVCGGSAVPLARSLMLSGFRPGTLFAFLLVGPALRGTTLANLSCLLSKRSLMVCLATLGLAGGLLGYVFDWLVRAF